MASSRKTPTHQGDYEEEEGGGELSHIPPLLPTSFAYRGLWMTAVLSDMVLLLLCLVAYILLCGFDGLCIPRGDPAVPNWLAVSLIPIFSIILALVVGSLLAPQRRAAWIYLFLTMLYGMLGLVLIIVASVSYSKGKDETLLEQKVNDKWNGYGDAVVTFYGDSNTLAKTMAQNYKHVGAIGLLGGLLLLLHGATELLRVCMMVG